MAQHQVTRTLVKSQPEVWAQCSDAESLERHLSGSFGEIRITRLDPEHSVAWEGEQVSGTVSIESSAWGTRVTMAVQVEGEEEIVVLPDQEMDGPVGGQADPESATQDRSGAQAAPNQAAEAPSAAARGLWARMRRRLRPPAQPVVGSPGIPEAANAPGSSAAPGAAPAGGPTAPQPRTEAAAALNAALESLGQAHHRPYSRA